MFGVIERLRIAELAQPRLRIAPQDRRETAIDGGAVEVLEFGAQGTEAHGLCLLAAGKGEIGGLDPRAHRLGARLRGSFSGPGGRLRGRGRRFVGGRPDQVRERPPRPGQIGVDPLQPVLQHAEGRGQGLAQMLAGPVPAPVGHGEPQGATLLRGLDVATRDQGLPVRLVELRGEGALQGAAAPAQQAPHDQGLFRCRRSAHRLIPVGAATGRRRGSSRWPGAGRRRPARWSGAGPDTLP